MQDSNTICQVSFMNNFLAHLVRRPLTFHILIFSSETPQPNELKLGRELQVSVHMAKIFLEKKSRLWWSFLLTDRDEMSHLYRG
jgi:hypothetical protein